MSRFQASISFALLVLAILHGVPRLANAQEALQNDHEVREYFAEQRQAYESAKTLKDAVTIAKQRLADQGLVEYAAIIDEARIKEAIRNSVDWWDSQHSRSEEQTKRPDVPQNAKDIVTKQAKHFRDIAKPQYEGITKNNKWPSGAYLFVQGGNTPGRHGLNIDLIIDTRNEDGSGFELGPDLPAITMHQLEVLRLNYGKVVIPENAKNDFKALSARN